MMWSRLVAVCCFCLLLTGVSSCPKRVVNKAGKIDSVAQQISEKRVFFDYDKYNISEAGANVLLDVIEILHNNPDMKVTIIGHTDNRGSYDYNVLLGEKRANAAKKFMVSCVPRLEDRIETVSRGETEPLVYVQDDSKNSRYEKQHAKNRRVEFLFFSGVSSSNVKF